MNSSKTKTQTIIAFKAEPDLAAAIDRAVRRLDTDRSKFIRAAVRREIAKRASGE
jgi:metal-responsive CopG/Arc/MetJ family transcriptional regulator